MAVETTVFVYTMNHGNRPGSWSRYVFPFFVDYWTQLDNSLYIRSGNDVLRLDETVTNDFDGDTEREQTFDGVIQWPWLDFGAPGVTKKMTGFDLTGTGNVTVQFGYDQRDTTIYTTAWTINSDTMPGGIMAMPLAAPTISVKLTYPGGQQWEWQAFTTYLQDFRVTAN